MDEAEQQLEFLKEIQSAIGKSVDLLFLSALLGSRRSQTPETVLAQLDEASNR